MRYGLNITIICMSLLGSVVMGFRLCPLSGPAHPGFSQSSLAQPSPVQPTGTAAVEVRIIADEAEAVLAILAKARALRPISEPDWQRLFTTEGYRRLKKREAAMRRPFTDEEFKSFVLAGPTLEKAQALETTLRQWQRADVTGAARRALAYLPEGARIRAKIYPVIKPKENSFVFEVDTDPAIFLYLDPSVSQEKFENTLAHELHHIGYGSGCPAKTAAAEIAQRPPNVRTVLDWVGAFGEGIAMLAAAGGPEIHPHAVSKPEDRARWDRDLANFNDDLRKVETFFRDILESRLSNEEIQQKGFSFFGIQGPWYTAGWKIAAIIEKTFGRATLIECLCDQRKLLPTYNRAAAEYNRTAKEPLAIWSADVIGRLSSEGQPTSVGKHGGQ